jgi:hypothetical protein
MAADDEEPQGCLTAILRLFGIKLSKPAVGDEALPYRLRDDFLSPAELSFYQVVRSAVGDRYAVCPKVSLADVFFVARPNENQRYWNKIDRKHVDFLVCEAATMRPVCGVELDDQSHSRQDRAERDKFVGRAFEAAGLPLLRFEAKRTYSPAEVKQRIEGCVAPPKPPLVEPAAGSPKCPKCGVPMQKKTASKGPNQGQQFWGCANYPRCREIVQV